MLRIYSLLSLCWLLVSQVRAQSLTEQANRQFDRLAYAKAVELYEQVLKSPASLSETERRAVKIKLAYSYHQIRDSQNAERVYGDLLVEGNLPTEYAQAYLHYAQALASNGKYREAQEAYEKYNTLQPEDKRSSKFTKLYRDVSALSRNTGRYKVEYLKMNTRRAEFSPILYRGGLVFVSAGDAKGIKRVFSWNSTPFLDLYYLPEAQDLQVSKTGGLGSSAAKRSPLKTQLIRPLGQRDYTASTANDSRTVGYFGGNNINAGLGYEERPVSESKRLGRALNTKYHEGPATFSKDGTRIIFTRNNFNNGVYRKSSDGINKLKLYTASQINGVWTPATELPFNSDEFSTGPPALSPDDQLLYFSSDRPGGYGGSDIYVARWENDKWSEPVNIGRELNSKKNELFPFVDEKGNLYVASDGHAGLGGLDLFFVELTNDGQHVKSLHNLGEPLNSAKDDFGIVTDGNRRTGYFSSNRKRGGADDDVYRFTREGTLYPCRELTVSVFDAESKAPLANTTILVGKGDSSHAQKPLKTNAEGLMRICLDADSDFRFFINREGYVDNKIGFSTRNLNEDQPSRLDIPLVVKKAAALVLRGRVVTQTGKQPIAGVNVILINECDGSSQTATTGPDGTYNVTVQPGCNYLLEAIKEKMGTTGGRMTEAGAGLPELTMFKTGDIIRIDNIHYDRNKATIRADAAAELDKVVALMTRYPIMNIEMRSHTDSRATAQYNKTLSDNRARAAMAYLKSKGIAAKRIVAKGYGESELLNTCKDGVTCSEEEHQQNRRTEIKVLRLE